MSIVKAIIGRAGSAPAFSAIYGAILGGPPSAPTFPVAPVQLATGLTTVFTPDWITRFFYYIDAGGGLSRWDRWNPTTAAVQLLTAGALGVTVTGIACSADSSTIYVATTGHTIVAIPTTTPYTPVVFAGSGAAGSTNGTGTAATFQAIVQLAMDPLAGGFLIAWEGDTGNLRRITVPGAVVTTPNTGIGGGAAQQAFALDRAGYYYLGAAETLVYGIVGSGTGGGSYSIPSNYVGPIAPSNSVPAANLYTFGSVTTSGKSLIRITQTGAVQQAGIAVFGTAVNPGSQLTGNAFFRPYGLYVVDTAGVLWNVMG